MIILSLILGLLGGGLVGGAMVLLTKLNFYLIVVVPVIGGAIIGFAIALPYLGRKASAASSGLGTGLSSSVIDNRPSRIPLIIIALLGTLIAIGIKWGGSYLVHQEETVAMLLEQEPSATREEAVAFIDQVYQEEYGATGFVGYINDMAEYGISISRASRSSDSGFTLAGGLAYAYWVIEALVMWGFAASTALGRARAVEEPESAEAAA